MTLRQRGRRARERAAVQLALAAHMPFESVRSAVTAACRSLLDVVPREAVSDLLAIGIPIETLERNNLGYGDGLFEAAYASGARTLDQLEAELAANCGHSMSLI